MSAGAARRLRRGRDLEREARRAVRVVSAGRGCTCVPTVDLAEIRPGAISVVEVGHADHCPRVQSPDGAAA
jgi:hypothetical protein